MVDGGARAGDVAVAQPGGDLADPRLGGGRVTRLEVRPRPGHQEREQVGGVVDRRRGRQALTAELERTVRVVRLEARLGQPPHGRRQALELAHHLGRGPGLEERRVRAVEVAPPEGDEAQRVERRDPGRQAAATVGERVRRHVLRLVPSTGRPQDMREMGRHVVAMVPAFDALGERDALGQPGIGPVVLDEDRGARPEHPVPARRGVLEVRRSRPLDPGLESRPAFGHVALEHEIGADGHERVQLRRGIAESDGQRDGPAAMLDRGLQATVEHVRGREARFESETGGLDLRARGSGVEQAERSLERPDARLEVVAEQVPDGDERGDDRGGADRPASREIALPGLFVGFGRGLVLVERGGLGGEGLEDLGVARSIEVVGEIAQRAPVELGRLPMRRPARRPPVPPRRPLRRPRSSVPPVRNGPTGTPRRRRAGLRPARRRGRACPVASARGRRRRSRPGSGRGGSRPDRAGTSGRGRSGR